jgi:uncharacterized protein YjbJ (UPF0337 family)
MVSEGKSSPRSLASSLTDSSALAIPSLMEGSNSRVSRGLYAIHPWHIVVHDRCTWMNRSICDGLYNLIAVMGELPSNVEDRDAADNIGSLGNLWLTFCHRFEHSSSVSDSTLNFDNPRFRIDPYALVEGRGQNDMHQEEISGKGKQIKGKVRAEVGKITGNRKEQVKGKIEQVQGKAEERLGKAKKKVGKK